MPNHRCIYEIIRRAITTQLLAAEERLPSTRSLAEDLTVSRNTILTAFEQLLDEGDVVSQTDSGTCVSYNHHDGFTKSISQKSMTKTQSANQSGKFESENIALTINNSNGLSKRGLAACSSRKTSNTKISNEVQPFTPGEDDYADFPYALWRRLLNRQWRTPDPALLDSSHDGGYLPLRKAIRLFTRFARS